MNLSGWRPFLRRLAHAIHGTRKQRPWRRGRTRAPLVLELLEDRVTPSGVAYPTHVAIAIDRTANPSAGPLKFGSAFAPAGILKAYGIDQLPNAANLGAGQTIAIIDAFDNPKFVNSTDPGFGTSDLHFFDSQFGPPDPGLVDVSQSGTSAYPATDSSAPPNDWESEEALDVEWAH